MYEKTEKVALQIHSWLVDANIFKVMRYSDAGICFSKRNLNRAKISILLFSRIFVYRCDVNIDFYKM